MKKQKKQTKGRWKKRREVRKKMKIGEKRLNERLQRLKDEEKAVCYDMNRAMSYIDEGGKKISAGLKDNNLMEVEAGYKLDEFGKEKENDARKRL